MKRLNTGLGLISAAAVCSIVVLALAISVRMAEGTSTPPQICLGGCIHEQVQSYGDTYDGMTDNGLYFDPFYALADELNPTVVGGQLNNSPPYNVDKYDVPAKPKCAKDESGGTQQEGSAIGTATFLSTAVESQVCPNAGG